MRIRITFSKTDAMRFTSHLDLYRTLERTIRRARLPLAYTAGFKPHPRINIASALPLGITGQEEIVDIVLEHELPVDEIHSALTRSAPPGVAIYSITPIDSQRPAIQSELLASEYMITFWEKINDLTEHLHALLQATEIPRTKRGKPYDLRSLIFSANVTVSEDDRQRIICVLSAKEGATGRPEELVMALGVDPSTVRIQRTRLLFDIP